MIANIISIYAIIGLLMVVTILVLTLPDDGYIHDLVVTNYDMYGTPIIFMWIAIFVGVALVWPAVAIIWLVERAKNR